MWWSIRKGKFMSPIVKIGASKCSIANGKFLTEWPTVEGVSGLFLTKDQHIWAGGVLLDLQGKVVGRLPGANAAGGHGVAVSESGDVYLAQLSGVVQKFVKQ